MSEPLQQNPDIDLNELIKTLPHKPGVYRYYDSSNTLIYVGKAGDLKKRVSSYFNKNNKGAKTNALVAQIHKLEFTVTRSDTEALILENNLIKQFKPKYNILLRDDKSYPYIFLSSTQDFPRLEMHRGPKREKGRYFGPFPNAYSARNTLSLLQKVFPVRQCDDNYFKNRSRPCLQFQIKRCCAPCVDFITTDDYKQHVDNAELFLEGKENAAIDQLISRMETASINQDYEAAASFRDQITHLRRSQDNQFETNDNANMDIIACIKKDEIACIDIFYVRNGRNLGDKTFFPKNTTGALTEDILSAFISQHYLADVSYSDNPDPDNQKTNYKHIPSRILINSQIAENTLLEQSLSEICGHKIKITKPSRGEKTKWVSLAESNAGIALDIHIANKATVLKRFEDLQDSLGLENLPQRIECFDISHTQGEATVASCVVFDNNGSINSDYRRFNIEGITGGDDYAAMKQAIYRRYSKVKTTDVLKPEILLIDGGKGQVTQAKQVLDELDITDIQIIGVAKGENRKPGLETLIMTNTDTGQYTAVNLPTDSPALHLIQNIRDEAHRFAITGHRQRRAKARTKSVLEDVKGLGAKRRQLLLKQFGGIQEVTRSSVDEIARVKGISSELAQRIYDALH